MQDEDQRRSTTSICMLKPPLKSITSSFPTTYPVDSIDKILAQLNTSVGQKDLSGSN